LKTLPFAAVWDYYCMKADAPVGDKWLAEVRKYEREVQSRRS
jgi:L-rhamnose isomerase